MAGGTKKTTTAGKKGPAKKTPGSKKQDSATTEEPEEPSVRYTKRPVAPSAAKAVFQELLIQHQPEEVPTYGNKLISALMTPQRALGYEVLEYAFVWLDAQVDLSSIAARMRVDNDYTFPEVYINDARCFCRTKCTRTPLHGISTNVTFIPQMHQKALYTGSQFKRLLMLPSGLHSSAKQSSLSVSMGS